MELDNASITLIPPHVDLFKEFCAYTQVWKTYDDFVPGSGLPPDNNTDMCHYENFTGYVHRCQEQEQGRNIPPGWVPNTIRWIIVDQKIVGSVQLRHHLNAHLEKVSGHIGYNVIPNYRGRGIAKAAVHTMLPCADQHHINPVIMTCGIHNYASQKVITACGGTYVNTITHEHRVLHRYHIQRPTTS